MTMRPGPIPSSFLFPQMIAPAARHLAGRREFIDYLFLAFNTSTAFSPTDTAVLDRWAKILTMLQSLISLSVLVVLAAGRSTCCKPAEESSVISSAPLWARRNAKSQEPKAIYAVGLSLGGS